MGRLELLQVSKPILTENKVCITHNNSRIERLRPSKPILIENEVRTMHSNGRLEHLQASKPIKHMITAEFSLFHHKLQAILMENEVNYYFKMIWGRIELLLASEPILTESEVCLTHNNRRIELL